MNAGRTTHTSTRREKWLPTMLESVTYCQPPQQILATHRAEAEVATHRFHPIRRKFGVDETLYVGAKSAVSEGQHGHRNPQSPADSSQDHMNHRMGF